MQKVCLNSVGDRSNSDSLNLCGRVCLCCLGLVLCHFCVISGGFFKKLKKRNACIITNLT